MCSHHEKPFAPPCPLCPRDAPDRIDGVVLMSVDMDLLKRARERMESIIATVREPVLLLDADLRVQMASGSFYRHFRVSREETEGRRLFELGNGQWNIHRLRQRLEQVLAHDGEFNDFEVQHDFAHMGPRRMLLNARRLPPIEQRSPVAILLAIEDISERTQGQTAALLASIVHSSMDAIISKNLDGIIQSWNQGAQTLFGYSAEEAVGRSISMLIPDDHLDEEPRILARIRAGEAIEHFETVRKRKDGSLIDISLTVSPVHDANGRIVGASKVARDISQRKRAGDALRESEERLRQLADQLADADRRKNEFLAMLAHEMRNPLAPIRNALEIVRRVGDQGDMARSAIEVMERQIAQLVHLVDDLLDVNRISRGKVELRKVSVDLASILKQALEIAQPICDHKGVALTVGFPSEPLVLNADPLRLVQALGNLLHNACKFTDPGGGAWLDVERDGAEVVIRVRDNGIGMAAEQLPQIFDMFVQADISLERSTSGLGIGLSLVKSLVELHGGTVQATSKGKGHGSEFVVRLPIEAGLSMPVVELPRVVEIAAPRARRILVVDDNRDAAETLVELLELSGHETRLAYDGRHAVELAAQFRPELVLLDIGLPNINGYDAAKQIRELPGGRYTVLVALTGWGHQEERQKSAEAGFDQHLVKPVHPEVLLKLIATLPLP